jgi:hypothetical protein
VVSDLVPTSYDLTHQLRVPIRAFSNQKEDGFQAMTVEDLEDRGRVLRVRAIIDRQQRMLAARRLTLNQRTEPRTA